MDQIKQREESTEPEKSQKLEGEVAPTAPPPPPHDPSCMNTSSVDRLSQRYASAYSSILPWIFSFDNSQSSGDTTLFPWCSAFVCPVTGKLFLPWCSDDGSPIDPKDPDCQRVRFCKKKKQADNLVATTVLSFFDRERLDPLNAKFCKYADDEAAALLAKLSGTVPQYIVEKVSIAQAVVREGNHDGDQRTEELESRLPRKRNRRREGKNRRQREESSVGESDHTKENHSTKDYSTHLEQLERRYSPEFSKSFSRWFVTWESGADRISSIFVCPKTASVFSASNCLHTDKRARCFHKGKDAENGAASVALDHFAQSGSNPLDAKVDAKEFDACSELLAGLHLPVYVSKRIAYARKLVAEGKHKGDKLTQVLGVAKSPKQLLTECYGKRLEDWFEPFPEESDWSAIFVCPLTGRVHLPDGSYGKSEEAPIRAFRSRAIAEQAAAAAALNYLERTGVVAATQKFNKEEMESVYANLRKAVRFPRSVLSLVATAQELVAEGGTFELMTEKLIRSRAATKEQATQVLIERSEMGAISSVASVQQVVSNANSQARNQAGAKPTFKTELSEIFEREGIKITPLVYFSWTRQDLKMGIDLWTAIFLDPRTGDLFSSCMVSDPSLFERDEEMNVVWYRKKARAENAAAARALAFFDWQDGKESKLPTSELPRPVPEPFHEFMDVPPDVQAKIENARGKVVQIGADGRVIETKAKAPANQAQSVKEVGSSSTNELAMDVSKSTVAGEREQSKREPVVIDLVAMEKEETEKTLRAIGEARGDASDSKNAGTMSCPPDSTRTTYANEPPTKKLKPAPSVHLANSSSQDAPTLSVRPAVAQINGAATGMVSQSVGGMKRDVHGDVKTNRTNQENSSGPVALKCQVVPVCRQRVLWWHTPSLFIPFNLEESMAQALLPDGKNERGMMLNKTLGRINEVKSLCRANGFPLLTALSLRRQHMAILNRFLGEEKLGLGRNADIKRAAQAFESCVETFLSRKGLEFYTEEAQRPHAQNGPTPDILFKQTTLVRKFVYEQGGRRCIEEKSVAWIDAKMFYGASTIPQNNKSAAGKILATAEKYVNAFGPGALVFLFGCGDRLAAQLEERGVMVLDCSSLETVSCEPVWTELRRWAGTSDGEILL